MSDETYNVTLDSCKEDTKSIEFCLCVVDGFVQIIFNNKSTLNRFGEIETPPMVSLEQVLDQIKLKQISCKTRQQQKILAYFE